MKEGSEISALVGVDSGGRSAQGVMPDMTFCGRRW